VYTASVAIHVVAAIVGFGATFTYPVIQLVAERHHPDGLQAAMGAILGISRWLAVPATTVVGITGAFQVADGPYELGDTWVSTGVALYAFVMVVGVFVLAPAYKRAERVLADPAGDDAERLSEYRRALRLPTVVGPVVSAAIVATAVIMEVKPD
jgi:uncharacterized membrane protein